LAYLLDRAGELDRAGLVCETCTAEEKLDRGCGKPPLVRSKEDDGSIREFEWRGDILVEEAKRLEADPDVDMACYLYPWANVGHIQERYGLGYWGMCPAYYSRFNKTDSLQFAMGVVEAAEWIRLGAPNMCLEGETPSAIMSDMIQFTLGFWQMQKAEAKLRAIEEAKSNISVTTTKGS
jgi:hypothetical protein